MADARLLGIGRAVPAQSYRQRELYEHRPWKATPLLKRLFLDSPIERRSLFVPPDWYQTARTLTETNQLWLEGSKALGGRALADVLARCGVPADQVDMFAVTSVTGYATPGLDLLLAAEHGLRPNIARAHFNCIGCHAAIPLLKVAADHVVCRPRSVAVALAVEVCSACFCPDGDPENLVALALFADGAAAVAVGTEGVGPRIVDFTSVYDFEHMDALGFGLTASGFRIVLDPTIPEKIAAHIDAAVDALLTKQGLQRDDVTTWCFHPGGSRILDAVQSALRLTDAAMEPSRHVLRRHGNMSSPSVLFVLSEALRAGASGYAVLAAFGPGLGIEAALLEL